MDNEEHLLALLPRLNALQQQYSIPVSDIATQAPAAALHSLHEASQQAPMAYREYLEEAIKCYEVGAYRGAVILVWSATISHLYSAVEAHANGISLLQSENERRFGPSKTYRELKKVNDLMYLQDSNFFLLCEDVGLFNRNARNLLTERLNLRNRCGHPTGYTIGREEAVVFIESLILNIIGGGMLEWGRT